MCGVRFTLRNEDAYGQDFDTSKQGPFVYLLISEQILQEIQGFRINPSYRPDHSMSLD